MKYYSILSPFLILLTIACVDSIFIDIGSSPAFPVVVDGHISNLPGPYTIVITQAFDIDSKKNIKIPVTVSRVTISDDKGVHEEFKEVDKGYYQTLAGGIQGIVGRVYTVRIEMLDGRIYESIPDTLLASGKIDSLYYTFRQDKSTDGSPKYGFDVFLNASRGASHQELFLWKFTGTFQSDTNPELACGSAGLNDCAPCSNNKPCSECSICNFKPLCSGIRNYGTIPTIAHADFRRVAPCSCCTCWYDFFNPVPILSDDQFNSNGRYPSLKVNYIPLDPWIFQHRVHIKLSQMSLTHQAYKFFNAVRSQKNAVNSLFQPITGKIPGNFVEVNGSKTPMLGQFFATGISNKTLFITREDVQPQSLIPSPELPWNDSCLSLFPNGTTTKPDYWD